MSELPRHAHNYFEKADSWAQDRERNRKRGITIAVAVALVASLIALTEAFALAALLPLKTVVPYTLLVDKQTGHVEAIDPTSIGQIRADAALTNSYLAQYVVAREGFQIDTLKSNYRKVALWSAGPSRERYIASMQSTNPQSPLARLPRRAIVDVEIRGITALSDTTSLVRFSTQRSDVNGGTGQKTFWSAAVTYGYSDEPMSVADRLINPLGFEVTRYHRTPDAVPDVVNGGPDRFIDEQDRSGK